MTFLLACDVAQSYSSMSCASVIAVVEDFLISMRGVHNCFDGTEVCSCTVHLLSHLLFLQNGPDHWTASRCNRTDVASKICSLEHLDAQILLDFAHNLDSVVELEMCVLCTETVSHISVYAYTASFFSIRPPPLHLRNCPVAQFLPLS